MVRVDRRRLRARRAWSAVKRIATYRKTYGIPSAYETMPGSLAVAIAQRIVSPSAGAAQDEGGER